MALGDGSALHSNMEEGAMLSYGNAGRDDLGWKLVLNEEGEGGSGSIIYSGDEISLQGSTGAYMHNNSEEGGGFSGGGFSTVHSAWIIELCDGSDGRISYGDDCMLIRKSDGACMHSNAGEGQGFSFGGKRPDLGWTILTCGNQAVEHGDYLRDGCGVHLAALGLGDGR